MRSSRTLTNCTVKGYQQPRKHRAILAELEIKAVGGEGQLSPRLGPTLSPHRGTSPRTKLFRLTLENKFECGVFP